MILSFDRMTEISLINRKAMDTVSQMIKFLSKRKIQNYISTCVFCLFIDEETALDFYSMKEILITH